MLESGVLLISLLKIKSLIAKENKQGLFKPNNKIAWLTISLYLITFVIEVVNTVFIIKLFNTDKTVSTLTDGRSQICREKLNVYITSSMLEISIVSRVLITCYMNILFSRELGSVNREFFLVFNASESGVHNALHLREERLKA